MFLALSHNLNIYVAFLSMTANATPFLSNSLLHSSFVKLPRSTVFSHVNWWTKPVGHQEMQITLSDVVLKLNVCVIMLSQVRVLPSAGNNNGQSLSNRKAWTLTQIQEWVNYLWNATGSFKVRPVYRENKKFYNQEGLAGLQKVVEA